jgi:CheY-like chemotaxis protein
MTSHSILVADHNPPISDVLKVFLEAEGYGVTVVNSSEQALKQGTSLRPQLLLIDPVMPGTSGVEVATRLSRETNCKVLFVTAFADDADFKEMVRGLQKQGCDTGILPKPFEKDQLLDSVRRKIGTPAQGTVEDRGADQAVGTAQRRATPPDEKRELTAYERLLEVATINLYQANAFRIAGLNVDASLRDVSKEAEKLELMLKLGRTPPPAAIFPLDEAPTIESVRNALQSLKDPESRLVQEFFWFWPCTGVSAGDPALVALCQGKYQAAVDSWTKTKGSGNGIAIHNLAVFHHLGALNSAVRRSKTLQPTAAEEIYLWTSAYRYWKALLDRTDFWEGLAARIRKINDPRLRIETAQRIWETLPSAIVKINAQIAVAAAERGDFEEAAKHRKLIYTSAFGEGPAKEETRRALSHAKDELERLCENAENEGRSNPRAANLVTRKLFDEKSRLLRAFNYLLGTGDPMCDAAHDRVAEAGRVCMVAYANETEDWEAARLIFEECLALAEGKALRLKLEEDLEIIGRNLVGQKQPQSSQQTAAAQPSTTAPETRRAAPAAPAKARNKNKYVAAIFVGAVVLFTAVKGCDDSSSPVQPASSQGVTQTTPSEPASQPTSGYTDYSPQQSPSPSARTTTTRAELKAEIEADNRTIELLEGEVKSVRSSVDEYDSLLNMDKSALERMKRDNDAGIEVDETVYEATRRRYNANVNMYNQYLTDYKAKAARYNQLLASTNAKIDRYNSQGGTR